MRKALSILMMFALVAGLLVACGKDGNGKEGGEESGEESKEEKGDPRAEKVKKRIEEMFEVMESGQDADIASFVVYKGPDKKRKWKEVCDFEKGGDRIVVGNAMDEIEKLMKLGEPEFVKFFTQKDGDRELLIWELKAGGKKKIVAMLDVGGTLALVDID